MERVYLDNAATSFPKSDGVFAAMKAAFYGCGNGGRGGYDIAAAAAETVYDCRERLSALFGTVPENVVLCSGATLALNMAIKGLAAEKCTVLCSVLEHNAVLRPLYALSAAGRIKLKFFTPSFESGNDTASAFEKALSPDVKLAVFTHASNVCGMTLPAERLCRLASAHGVRTVVDCAQTAGHIPVNIAAIGADVICIAGHKGIGGPMGTGALLVHPKRGLWLSTLVEGGTGAAGREHFMPRLLPERLEAGTANITGIAGLSAAALELSINPEREKELRERIVSGLKGIKNVRLYGEGADVPYMPLVLFNVGKVPSETVAERLSERGICVRGGLHCAPLAHSALGTGRYGGVRVSLGKANTDADCDALLSAVEEISASV